MESKMNKSNNDKQNKNKKMSNTPYILLILALFAILGYQYYQYYVLTNPSSKSSNNRSNFANVPMIPYIAQSVYINIYATPEDYPKYQWLFKGTLLNTIRINYEDNFFVMIPPTLVNIPIRVFNNASKTRFTILANGLEQDIQQCDFIGTTF
jgi:hypothetical protein